MAENKENKDMAFEQSQDEMKEETQVPENEAEILENDEADATSESEEAKDDGTQAKAESEPEKEAENTEKKSGFFDKLKKDKKDKKDVDIEELKDRLMRQMAEFDNYRKRTDKEKKMNYEIGASDFILKILPVVDNFERGLGAMTAADKETSFAQGIEMIYKQLTKALEDAGVTAIEAVGKEFDPMLHNAVMQQPSEEYESGVVMQEFQKGYMYKEKVIRHSMVMVAE